MSLQVLANTLDLSISTVSRALNGYHDVSAATRSRVMAAARSMNYRPHPLAHRLATGKTGAIAVVNSVRAGDYLDASFAALTTSIAQVMRTQSYFTLAVGLPVGDSEIPELDRFLNGRLVDGVILARTRIDDSRVRLLQQFGIPFITYGRTLENEAHAWVDTDNERAFFLATQQLIALGHQSLALINGLSYMTFAALRERGFWNAVHANPAIPALCKVCHTEVTATAGRAVMEQLLNDPVHPSAVLCATDAQAVGAMAAIKAAGLTVGRDISVMGYGNTEVAQCIDPPLASIDHAISDNGEHLARLLIKRMTGEPVDGLNRLEPVNIVTRASVGEPCVDCRNLT